jgi:hypothetical protein
MTVPGKTMALPSPFSEAGHHNVGKSGVNQRREPRLVPVASLPVRVAVAALDGSWSLGERAAWDISREGVAAGLLDAESADIRLSAPVQVALTTPEWTLELKGLVAHLSRSSMSPIWPAVIGLDLGLPGTGPLRAVLMEYIDRIEAARQNGDPKV